MVQEPWKKKTPSVLDYHLTKGEDIVWKSFWIFIFDDGDCLNFQRVLGKRLHEVMRRLHPSTNVYSLRAPRSISNNLAMPSPVLATVNLWLNEE